MIMVPIQEVVAFGRLRRVITIHKEVFKLVIELRQVAAAPGAGATFWDRTEIRGLRGRAIPVQTD